MVEVKRLVFLLVLIAAACVFVGCAQVRDEDVSKPWAEPEPWERNMGIGPLSPE